MMAGNPTKDGPLPVMGGDIGQHIRIGKEFMLVYSRIDHKMDIVMQPASMSQQHLNGDPFDRKPGQVFGNRIMYIQFAFLPKLQDGHSRERLGNGSEVKSRMKI